MPALSSSPSIHDIWERMFTSVMFSSPFSLPVAALLVWTYKITMSVAHCSLTSLSSSVEFAPSGR